MGKEQRVRTALRQIEEFFSGKRKNPRICLTEEEAEVIIKEKSVYIRKGNVANDAHNPTLYMYKIIAR